MTATPESRPSGNYRGNLGGSGNLCKFCKGCRTATGPPWN